VIVLGDIGSGKSSFLLAILNEMKNSCHSMVTVNGSVAYAAQKPCIMSGTVRENILFGAAYDKKRFE
jgi:ABC-type transport system involved in cytochrome bd biosynthesis fused ATPase/permease subunit